MPVKNEAAVVHRKRIAPTTVRVELPSATLRLAADATDVARYAADELSRYLHTIFGFQTATHPLSNTANSPASGLQFTLAVATPTFALDGFLANFQQPPLEEQEYLILPVEHGQSLLIAGGSPASLLWAVYELAEFWGARFLLTSEHLPTSRKRFSLPDSCIRRKPSIPLRGWRGLNQLPHSGIHWGLSDYEELINRLAKLRFNCFYVMLPPYGPFVDFEWCGLSKHTGELDFGWRFPIDHQTIGREKFNGLMSYENPDIPSDGSYKQKIAAASKLIEGIRSLARARGMAFAARFTFTEFPEEFKEHLRRLSLQDGFAPAKPESGYVYRLGISREGLDPMYSPFMSIRNPRFVDLVSTQLQAYLERFGNSDYLVLHPPEFANSSADAEFAWSKLSQKYGLGPIENLTQLVNDSVAQLKNDPNAGPSLRMERQIRAHICSLYLLDELLQEQKLAKLYENSGAKLVVGLPFSTLAPLTAQVLGKSVDLMTLLGSGYLASDAARHAGELKRPDDQTNDLHLTVSLEDDNIGLSPQFTAPSLEKIISAMRQYKVTGLWCRQWLMSKLDPAVDFVARACWDSSLTPSDTYADLINSVCGEEALESLLAAFQIGEQITIENDTQGNIHSFLTPGLLAAYWDLNEAPKPSLLAMRPKYHRLTEQLEIARSASRIEGRPYIDQFICQSRFAEFWITTIEKLYGAAEAKRTAQAARQKSDVHLMDEQLQLSVSLLDQSLESCRAAISAWADGVRDRADLGALAALNQFGYRFLLSLRYLRHVRATHWGMQLDSTLAADSQ